MMKVLWVCLGLCFITLALLWSEGFEEKKRFSRLFVDERESDFYLEDIEGEQALTWVREQNRHSLDRLESDPRFAGFKDTAFDRLNSDDKIHYPQFNLDDERLYNLVKNKKNPRGILRSITLESYLSSQPQWEVVLDFDELAKSEGENWIYKGGQSYKKQTKKRSMIRLSRGGKDATVMREYDVETKQFVRGGFKLEEAKSRLAWIDQDTLIVGTDFGPDSLTTSGYPRILKLWKRNTDLGEAPTVFEGTPSDVSVASWLLESERGDHIIIERHINFLATKFFILSDAHRLQQIKLPEDIRIHRSFQGNLIVINKEDWHYGDRVFRRGSVMFVELEKFLAR